MDHPEDIFNIRAERILPADAATIVRLLGHAELFPEYLPQIKECCVLSRVHTKIITNWKVELDHVPISWKEESSFDLRNMRVSFRSLEGDLEIFEGTWKLKEHAGGGTEVRVEARIKIGIPVLERVVGGLIAEKVQKFFDQMLLSLEEHISAVRYKKIDGAYSSQISGFGVIGHPYNFNHLVSYLKSFKPDFEPSSEDFVTKVFDLMPSYISYDVKEFKSAGDKKCRGAFIACNLIPDLLTLDIDKAVNKVVESCKVAERLGLGIVALGGFTSIAGERYGDEFRKKINIPVTTGNTLTAALAIEGILKAAALMELELSNAKVTVIGGAGDIGSACARVLAGMVKEVTITSRSPHNLKKWKN